MIFLDKYDQCNCCRLSQICAYSRDYYMNKGGNYREQLQTDSEGNCKHAPFSRKESEYYNKVDY